MEKEKQTFLPIGSVIRLKEDNICLMIVSRAAFVPLDNLENTTHYMDYIGVYYPQGLESDELIYFNNENIDEILFTGYKCDDEKFMNLMLNKKLEDSKYEKITLDDDNE